jgi:hypothetical protein
MNKKQKLLYAAGGGAVVLAILAISRLMYSFSFGGYRGHGPQLMMRHGGPGRHGDGDFHGFNGFNGFNGLPSGIMIALLLLVVGLAAWAWIRSRNRRPDEPIVQSSFTAAPPVSYNGHAGEALDSWEQSIKREEK